MQLHNYGCVEVWTVGGSYLEDDLCGAGEGSNSSVRDEEEPG